MNIVDILVVAALAVAMPIYGGISYRRYLTRIEAGLAPDKATVFRDAIVMQWSFFAVLIGIWVWYDREAHALGILPLSGWGAALGLLLTLAVSIYLLLGRRKARQASAEERAEIARQMGALTHFLPSTRAHLHWFYALSVTAGIVEELLYRGYFFWLFTPYMPAWAVLLLSSAIFGLGHSYQGLGGMLRVFVIGLCFGGLYLLTDSIWIPMIAHAVFDILQGAIIFEYQRADRALPAASETATAKD